MTINSYSALCFYLAVQAVSLQFHFGRTAIARKHIIQCLVNSVIFGGDLAYHNRRLPKHLREKVMDFTPTEMENDVTLVFLGLVDFSLNEHPTYGMFMPFYDRCFHVPEWVEEAEVVDAGVSPLEPCLNCGEGMNAGICVGCDGPPDDWKCPF